MVLTAIDGGAMMRFSKAGGHLSPKPYEGTTASWLIASTHWRRSSRSSRYFHDRPLLSDRVEAPADSWGRAGIQGPAGVAADRVRWARPGGTDPAAASDPAGLAGTEPGSGLGGRACRDWGCWHLLAARCRVSWLTRFHGSAQAPVLRGSMSGSSLVSSSNNSGWGTISLMKPSTADGFPDPWLSASGLSSTG